MKQLSVILFVLCSINAQSQIYPTKSGEELKTLLVQDYKPSTVLTYGMCRDTMYKNIYRDKDGFKNCTYTDYHIYLPLSVDPSSFLYDNENPNGITCEHTYPQSKGAGNGNAKSDMHALEPVIWRANEGRSNYPFAEIDDTQTDHWYWLDYDDTDIPSTDIDKYSEKLNGGFGNIGAFEPRESVKGDIARCVFYFFTMYESEALEADPDFFEEMKSTLMDWHHSDPVDSLETAKTYLKASYQDNKPNPFILDCSLVGRAYGSGSVAL